jgi:hypothetical protein
MRVPTRKERQLKVLQTVAPATAHQSGLPLAVAIALSVTALVALGMILPQLRRTSRLSAAAGSLGAAAAVGAVVLALLAFTGPSASPSTATVPFEVTDYAVETYQLETLAVE